MQASRTTSLPRTYGLKYLIAARCMALASCSRNISYFHANRVLSACGSVPSFGIRALRLVDDEKRGLSSFQNSVEDVLSSSHPSEVSLSAERADSPSRSGTTRPNEKRPREIPKKKLALLYVRGFPLYMLPQDVQTKFEHLGPVKHMWMERTAAGELTGEATIMYENPTQVERIMRLQNLVPIVVEGNVITASYCWGLNKPVGNEWLLVYNLPEGVLEEEVKEALKAEAVRFTKSPDDSILLASARFESKERADEAFEKYTLEPIIMSDKKLRVVQNGVREENYPIDRWMVVSCLPKSATVESMRGLFPQALQVNLYEPNDRHPKPFAFVRFERNAVIHQTVEGATTTPLVLDGEILQLEPLVQSINDHNQSKLYVTVPPTPDGRGIGLKL